MSDRVDRKHTLGIVRLSLSRPITVSMAFLAILVLGIVSYLRLPLQLLPSEGFSGQSITIVVPYPNASPAEAEASIVRPIEEAIGRVPGVKEIISTAFTDGAQVRVSFHGKADIHLAQADLKEQLERIRKQFPQGADRYFLYKFNMDDALPVIFTGILIDPGTEDIHRKIDEIVKPRLERLDGVAQVAVFGLRERQVIIEIDRDSVTALDIPLYAVIQRLSEENRSLSVGDIEEGEREFLVRAMGEFESLEEIESFPIRPGLQLRDVATIQIELDDEETLTRVNRKPAAILIANKESSANTVDVCERLDAEIATFADDSGLAGLTFHTYFNQGKFIIESIGVLRETALIGGALAVIVLFIFMRHVAMTLIVALAIPLSLLPALVLIFFTSGTLNVFSMMGLTLGIGMLVDNSIVVAENIDRMRREGKPIRLAALLGSSQVGLAIIMSTATTAVVFVPLIFLGDDSNTRVMMKEIGFPVIYSLAASLFVALTFVPLALRTFGRRNHDGATGWRAALRKPLFLPLFLKLYDKLLPLVLRFRLETLLFVVVPFLMTTGLAFYWVQKTADLGGDSSQLRIDMKFPANLSLDEADRLVQGYERILDEQKGSLGFRFFAAQFQKNGGQLDLFLERDAPYDKKELIKRLEDLLPVRAGTELIFGGQQTDEREATLRVLLSGPDSNELARIGREIVAVLDKVEGLEQVRSALDDEEGVSEIRVGLKRDLAREFDINPQEVLGLVGYSLRGAKLPDFESGRETLEVWARFSEEDRAGIEKLENVRVPTPDGGSISLATVASFDRARGYRSIRRENRKTVLAITARYSAKDQASVTRRAREAMSTVALPRGYSYQERGGFRDFQETAREISLAFMLGLVFVYLLMGILFESFVLPCSVVFAIPFCLCGGMWGLVVTRTPLDSVAMIGFIILLGVVVNNAIVLIDAINRRRSEGIARTEAILEAARHRFRPIWMTALTTILGLLPMAVREGAAEGVSYLTMARAVIGGLLVATVFTLLIVPLFYTLFDDLRRFVSSALAALLTRRSRETSRFG